MLVRSHSEPQLRAEMQPVYQPVQGDSNGDIKLPPLIACISDPPISELQSNSADAILAPKCYSPRNESAHQHYKCSMCSYSSYICAFCECHIAHNHSMQAHLQIPIETTMLSPVIVDQFIPYHQQALQPYAQMILHSLPLQSTPILCLATAYYTPVTPLPYETVSGSPVAGPPVGGSAVAGSLASGLASTSAMQEQNTGHSTDSKSDLESDVAKLQVCTVSGCGYASNSKKFFQKHTQFAHRGRRQMKCTRCQFSTHDPAIYKRHLLEHLGL